MKVGIQGKVMLICAFLVVVPVIVVATVTYHLFQQRSYQQEEARLKQRIIIWQQLASQAEHPNELKSKLTSYHLREANDIWIIDASGKFVFPENPLKPYPAQELSELVHSVPGDEVGIFYYDWHRTDEETVSKKVIAFSHVPGHDWVIAVEADMQQLPKTLSELKKNIIYIVFLMVLFSLLPAYYLSSHLMKPLKNLHGVALRAVEGEFDGELDNAMLSRRDELGDIFNAFKMIFSGLRELIDQKENALHELDYKTEQLAEIRWQLEQEKRRYQRLTVADPLTEVNNRQAFMELASVEIKRAQRSNKHVAVAIIDVDHLKKLNDDHGHEIGDGVLIAVARLLRQNLRATDSIGRISSEEFAIISASPRHIMCEVMDRLRIRLGDAVIETEKERIYFTVSVGIAEISVKDETLDEALKRAYTFLRQAKSEGRNLVVCEGEVFESSSMPCES